MVVAIAVVVEDIALGVMEVCEREYCLPIGDDCPSSFSFVSTSIASILFSPSTSLSFFDKNVLLMKRTHSTNCSFLSTHPSIHPSIHRWSWTRWRLVKTTIQPDSYTSSAAISNITHAYHTFIFIIMRRKGERGRRKEGRKHIPGVIPSSHLFSHTSTTISTHEQTNKQTIVTHHNKAEERAAAAAASAKLVMCIIYISKREERTGEDGKFYIFWQSSSRAQQHANRWGKRNQYQMQGRRAMQTP